MALHNSGEKVAVFLPGKGLYCLDRWKRLEAELGAETEIVVQILAEGQLAVPYVPVVSISAVVVVGLVKALVRFLLPHLQGGIRTDTGSLS